ncbi:MAG: sodium/proline symporter [Ignavibacteria bacterium]|nr:sodium/proline symporter [Ignavibacteria bacterium]
MIAVFFIYLGIVLIISFISARRVKTTHDFILGGKKFSGVSLALSERATGESAWLLLGLTGEAYLIGFQAIWIALGCVIGIGFIWFVMGNRLREKTEKYDAYTVPGLLSKHFPGSEKLIGILSAIIVVFFFTFYIAAQFSGGGKILQDTFGLNPFWGMMLSSVIVIFYCMIGGFITVVVTDIFQSILMMFTLIILPVILILTALSQNIDALHTLAISGKTSFVEGTGFAGILFVISGLSWAFGYTGQPQLLSRMMAIKNEQDVKYAKWTAIFWTLLAYLGALTIGYMGIVFVKNGIINAEQTGLIKDYEVILPVLINFFTTPIVAGLLLSGVISAMMSTASSEIIISSSAVTEDIYMNLKSKSSTEKIEHSKLWLNKIVTLTVGVIALILAITVKDTVYGLVSYAWSGIGSSFGPALILLLFWKRLSRVGVVASLISGTISTIIWKNFLLTPTGISERLGSYIFALLMAIIFSLIFPEKTKAK